MSFRERNIEGEERECEQSDLGSIESKSVRQNGSLTTTQLIIDNNLLVDPKLLIIGSKIGEGAHGKVYEGRSVSKPCIRLDVPTTVVTIIMYIFGSLIIWRNYFVVVLVKC